MKKLFIALGSLVLLLWSNIESFAQVDSSFRRYKIAVLAPLYLDSAFDVLDEYQYGKTFPKFFNPGLEFYEGIQLAADTLNKIGGAALDIHIYDTRSQANPVANIFQKAELSELDLIIGHVTNNEIKVLSDIAVKRNIPFINANIPNDGGVTNNPSLVILNSTLKTHCQAIYKFLQKNYSTTSVVVFTRKGIQEDILRKYFTEIERTTVSGTLRLKFITLNSDFTSAQLLPYLDSTRVTMCMAASLNEQFAKLLSIQLAFLNKTYPIQVMGMPTWDVIKDFQKTEYKGLEIFYSTPFSPVKTDKASIWITNYFKTYMFSRPSDMVFRGYECLMHFGKLLMDHGPNLSSSIGEKKHKVFTDFDIQPVFLNTQSPTLDYFENRKLYFVKLVDGNIKGVY